MHYENNSPFLTVTSLTRVIEVSQWGNIAVEETFNIEHSGAVLKGSFSRHDYQRNQDGLSSIKAFKVVSFYVSAFRSIYIFEVFVCISACVCVFDCTFVGLDVWYCCRMQC